MSDSHDKEFEHKVLEFTETSAKHVQALEKRASTAEARVAELETQLAEAKSSLQKQASAEVFDEDRVRELSDLLVASGFVKESSEAVQESFKTDPNSVLGVFSEMVQSGADGSELTTIKSSRDYQPDLWRQAATK